jgi:Double-GTPase 2
VSRNVDSPPTREPGFDSAASDPGARYVPAMAKYPRIREQHIAVFGEGGSGKTVLASSFYGPSQEKSFSNGLWDLVADDTGLGNRLYSNYVGMRDHATVPATTRFASTTYYFSVKLKRGGNAKAKKRPFDILRLGWHDYPGEWFEESPSSEEEANRRVDTFRSLLRSDVALLLVDGQKLLDYRGEEERYLKSLLTNFRQGLLRLKEDLLAGEGRLDQFPRVWIIALSKADLFPDWDVHSFRDLVIWKATEHIEHLRATLQDFVVTPEALSMGDDFMLLSSAKFELFADGPEPVEIDVTKRVGVDLILPVASLLPLEHLVQWQEKIQMPMKVLDTLVDDTLARVLVGGISLGVSKVVAKLPAVGPLASKAVIPALMAAVKMAESQLRQINEQARESHDYVTATLTQFKLDLDRGETDGLLIRGK